MGPQVSAGLPALLLPRAPLSPPKVVGVEACMESSLGHPLPARKVRSLEEGALWKVRPGGGAFQLGGSHLLLLRHL